MVTAALGDICNTIGAYLINLGTQCGDVVIALVGRS